LPALRRPGWIFQAFGEAGIARPFGRGVPRRRTHSKIGQEESGKGNILNSPIRVTMEQDKRLCVQKLCRD
jgi:hypothetical protein